MGGIGLTLNIASEALSAQQSALNVTSQNIANATNADYSRQIVCFENVNGNSYGGYLLGSGVEVSEVKSACDQILEDRLTEKNSELSAYEEMASALSYMESIFAMDSEAGLNAALSDFWNSWDDLANNPSGTSERQMVYDAGESLAAAFNTASENLLQLSNDANMSIDEAVSQVNTITDEIALLNQQITAYEANGMANANDLRDQRQALVNELAEIISIDVFEQSNGSITLTTGEGALLVSGVETHTLDFSGGKIVWNSSAGPVNITEDITIGNIGGWLSIRDESIPKYQADLESLADEMIWAVNSIHSQGTGVTYCSTSVSGTYATDGSGLLYTLSYADKIDTSEDFSIWIQNSASDPATYQEVSVDLSDAAPVASADIDVSGTANSVLDTYQFTVDPPDGVIDGTTTVELSWSCAQSNGNFTIEAGTPLPATVSIDGMDVTFSSGSELFPNGTFTITTDGNGNPSENVSDYTLEDLADDINTAVTNAGGGVKASVVDNRIVFTPDSNNISFAFGGDDSGMASALGVNTFFTGTGALDMGVNGELSNTDLIAAGQIDASTGEIASGDNANGLAMVELQNEILEIPQWAFDRHGNAVSSTVSGEVGNYYQTLVSAVGMESAAAQRQQEFAELMVNDFQTQRDEVSAVSLDEEMINLTKYQAAYEAAAKLMTVADEMLNTLLSIR